MAALSSTSPHHSTNSIWHIMYSPVLHKQIWNDGYTGMDAEVKVGGVVVGGCLWVCACGCVHVCVSMYM